MSDTKETLELFKAAMTEPSDMLKSFVQPSTATTGLQVYDLEAPSKKLYPVLTPLRNSIARVSGGRAIQANWKAIVDINVGNTRAGVSEGKRGGLISHDLKEYIVTGKQIGRAHV